MAQGPPAAFFSYSREDSDFALRLAADLKAAGANVWLDQLDIAPGNRWDRAIEDALNYCPRIVVILSPAAVGSTNVMDEVSFALEEQKIVIPIIYQDCTVPFRLRRVQNLDFRQDYARGLQELLTTLALGPSTEQNVSAVSDAKSNGPSNVPRVDKRQLAPEQPSLEDAGREAIEQVERTKPERERTRRATHKESLAAGAIAALSVPKSKTSPTIRNVAVGAIIVIVVAAGAFFVASFLAPEVRPFLHLGKQTGVVSNSTQPKTATPGSTTSSSPLIGVLADTATFRDPDSLIEFRYPRRLFHREDVVESHEVVRLQSDEKVVISVSIVATDRDDALIRAYELDLETPGKPIHYKTGVHNGWYVVSGFDGPILFYRRVVSTRGHIAALTISHDKSITPSFNPAVVIAQTFRAID